MIKYQDLTPSVYYNQSRDFQFMGRVLDVLFNSALTNSEIVTEGRNSENIGGIVELLAMTLGFSTRHKYNIKQLVALCSSFSEILRYKGTLKAITLAANVLLHAEGIKSEATCHYAIGSTDNTVIEIVIDTRLSDITLFKDILRYILPAGVSYNIIRTSVNANIKSETKLTTVDVVEISDPEPSNQPTLINTFEDDKYIGTSIGTDPTDIFNNNTIYTQSTETTTEDTDDD